MKTKKKIILSVLSVVVVGSIILFSIFGCQRREVREVNYDNGQLKEKFMVIKTKDDSYLKDGKYSVYYENGQIREEGRYKKDKLEGLTKIWYESGRLMQTIPFKNGVWHGDVKWFDEEGTLIREIGYKEGNSNGKFDIYKDGNMLVSGKFKDGVADGKFTLFEDDGKSILSTVELENGAYTKNLPGRFGKEHRVNADLLGFELGKTTYSNIKLGFLDKGFVLGENFNENSNRKIIVFDGEDIGLDFIKNGKFIFDNKDILIGIQYLMDKNNPTRYSSGFGGGFKSMYAYFRDEKYKLLEKKVPFVGNTHAIFKKNNSYVHLDAPHLNTNLTVNYWLGNNKNIFM